MHHASQIDVMFLYSELGRELLGNISPEQIETTLLEALVWTNEAMVNSEIDLVFSLVYVGEVSITFRRILCRGAQTANIEHGPIAEFYDQGGLLSFD